MAIETQNKNYEEWIREIFDLSKKTQIDIHEKQINHQNHIHIETNISININEDKSQNYVIKKPLDEIQKRDIKNLKRVVKLERRKLHPVFGPIFRFFAWWFAFTGLYSMFAVCPFCGQAGCVVGVGSAGVVGGFFAFLLQYGKTAVSYIKNIMLKAFTLQSQRDAKL